MDNKNLIIILVIIVAIGVLLWQFGALDEIINKTEDFIKVRLYDTEGNPISVSQSIVNGQPGVGYIDLTVSAVNTGNIALTCSIISVSPSSFDTAIDKGLKVVPTSGTKKASWTSNLIAVSPLESLTQPVRFQATIRCSYKQGTNTITLPDKTGYVDITVTSDNVNAGYDVDVGTGGTGSEYCGDGICQSGSEDALSCPNDCALVQNVKFRTSDLSYVTGSAIGYSSSCGSILTRYGHTGSTGSLTGNCTSGSKTWCSASSKLFDIKGGWRTGGSAPSVWSTSVSGQLCVCDDGSDGSYSLVKYSSSDSDYTKVSNQTTSFDIDKEVTC